MKISIIMPCYNRKFCIEKAIESVLIQIIDGVELIIIDDGSTDGTEDFIFEKYSHAIEDSKLRYIKLEKNYGQSKARNIGLKLAFGDWICYLDSDNKLLPGTIDKIIWYISNNKNAKCFYAKRLNDDIKEFDYERLQKYSYIDLNIFIHSRKLYICLGGFDERLDCLEDWELIVRYTKNNTPIFIDENFVDYDGGDFERITNRKVDITRTQLLAHYLIMKNNFSFYTILRFIGKGIELIIRYLRNNIYKLMK